MKKNLDMFKQKFAKLHQDFQEGKIHFLNDTIENQLINQVLQLQNTLPKLETKKKVKIEIQLYETIRKSDSVDLKNT